MNKHDATKTQTITHTSLLELLLGALDTGCPIIPSREALEGITPFDERVMPECNALLQEYHLACAEIAQRQRRALALRRQLEERARLADVLEREGKLVVDYGMQDCSLEWSEHTEEFSSVQDYLEARAQIEAGAEGRTSVVVRGLLEDTEAEADEADEDA